MLSTKKTEAPCTPDCRKCAMSGGSPVVRETRERAAQADRAAMIPRRSTMKGASSIRHRVYTARMFPQDPLEKHFTSLRPEQKRALGKLGIRTIRDLLYHFPSRYERSGPRGTIAGVTPGAQVVLYGTIKKPETRKSWKSRRP